MTLKLEVKFQLIDLVRVYAGAGLYLGVHIDAFTSCGVRFKYSQLKNPYMFLAALMRGSKLGDD